MINLTPILKFQYITDLAQTMHKSSISSVEIATGILSARTGAEMLQNPLVLARLKQTVRIPGFKTDVPPSIIHYYSLSIVIPCCPSVTSPQKSCSSVAFEGLWLLAVAKPKRFQLRSTRDSLGDTSDLRHNADLDGDQCEIHPMP